MERTFVMVKPDGVDRALAGEILARIERKGYKPVAVKLMRIDEALAKRHYAEHDGKPFFPSLIEFITSGPVLAMVIEGPGVIDEIRKLVGKTDPREAAPGTIRGDLSVVKTFNLIHASDKPESAAREIANFFRPEEIVAHPRSADRWLV